MVEVEVTLASALKGSCKGKTNGCPLMSLEKHIFDEAVLCKEECGLPQAMTDRMLAGQELAEQVLSGCKEKGRKAPHALTCIMMLKHT